MSQGEKTPLGFDEDSIGKEMQGILGILARDGHLDLMLGDDGKIYFRLTEKGAGLQTLHYMTS